MSTPDDLKRQGRAQAVLQGKDLSRVVRVLLRLWLEGEIELSESEERRAAEDQSPEKRAAWVMWMLRPGILLQYPLPTDDLPPNVPRVTRSITDPRAAR